MKIPDAFVARLKHVAALKLAYKESTDRYDAGTRYYDAPAVVGWLAKARSALEAVFPSGHAVLNDWADLTRDEKNRFIPHNRTAVESAQALVGAATEIVESGGLDRLVEGIKAETVAELLAQAEQLLSAHYRVAAVVLAGGALETHLRFLCDRHALEWEGHGSIAAYDGAIAKARNEGKEVYGVADTRNVSAWGSLRNDAAHKPGEFERKDVEVRLYLDGIRQFVARTT